MPLLTLKTCKIDKKRIFLRADLNVTFKNNFIIDAFRLESALPTLRYLISHQAKIVLATHLGSPKDPKSLVSTKLLVPWFAQNGILLDYAPDIAHAQALLLNGTPNPIVLENLRLFPGEQSGEILFARQLAELADVYVNDAFGTIHRTDTSIAQLPLQFDPVNRCIGLCVEQEIKILDHLKKDPQQPFILVLGGAKLDDKIPFILQFITAAPAQRPAKIIIGGAMALPFLKALGHGTGATVLTDHTVETARTIIEQAAKHNVLLILPSDLAIVTDIGDSSTAYALDQIPANGHCVDIGPKTILDFTKALTGNPVLILRSEASGRGTILTNGTMGMYEHHDYQTGTRAILQVIARSSGYTVAGGGDCSAAVHTFGLEKHFSFISTGGGATLAYLSSTNPLRELPGLHALSGKQNK